MLEKNFKNTIINIKNEIISTYEKELIELMQNNEKETNLY